MSQDYYDTLLTQRGAPEAFAVAADDARKLRARIAELEAERERLRRAINDVYPSVAGRAINLEELGEEKAAEEWHMHAWVLRNAVSRRSRGVEVPREETPE